MCLPMRSLTAADVMDGLLSVRVQLQSVMLHTVLCRAIYDTMSFVFFFVCLFIVVNTDGINSTVALSGCKA